MRTLHLLIVAALAFGGCGLALDEVTPSPNRWSDERLWPVLDAQERRNVSALCALLEDSSAAVRTAAALAFASVQDSASVPCLLAALQDPDVDVRVNAVFALGFIANDSTVDRMAERSGLERDSTVHRAYLQAMFLNLQRRGKLKEVAPAVYYLERSAGQERMRAADAIRRLAPTLLLQDSALVLRAAYEEQDPEVKALLLRALQYIPGPRRTDMLLDAGGRGKPLPVRISAMMALGHQPDTRTRDSLLKWVNDPIPAVRTAAIDALHNGGVFGRGGSYWSVTENDRWFDALTRNRVLGLMAYNTGTKKKAVHVLNTDTSMNPFAEAERIKARSMVNDDYRDTDLEKLVFRDAHPVIRQAAFGVMADRNLWALRMPRAVTPDMQLREAAPFWHRVFGSADPGLICAAAEKLTGMDAGELRVLIPEEVERKARATLQPLRDLEAVQRLDDLAAKRNGLPPIAPRAPVYNHPIDRAKLRALQQGQRYRIVTTKGEIIIATNVNECPGSSLAFDSLVTAGYYNGKAFHRLVPNFVVQGGCPRGDGYGGMHWTLRTEIGRTPFTRGSVGLASAGRDTESCQFFITHSAAPHLDGRYTRFGEVVSGMDVVWSQQVGDIMQRVEQIRD
jgi:cyclophilin family peptidyl-prolyl cis-trans isomerase